MSIEQLATEITQHTAAIVTSSTVSFEPATVDGINPGAAQDGYASVSVTWRGETNLPMPYLQSYSSPVIGDVVLLLVSGPQMVILDRIIGLTDPLPVDDLPPTTTVGS